MSYLEHKELSPRQIDVAVITVSDSRTLDTDESGKLIINSLKEGGHHVKEYLIIKNNPADLLEKLENLLKREDITAIITTGGTGISQHDITVETISQLIDKKIDGFGELFRLLTYQEIGTGSIMSRALAGVAKGKVIICLPGSVDAVKLAVDRIILPEIGHLTREATR